MRPDFTPKQIELFLSRVNRDVTPLDCWEWNGTVDRNGYGVFCARTKHTKRNHYFAHRVMWMLVFGDDPVGMSVCHSCDNPKCVNPFHLWEGTQRQNMKDMIAKGRDACLLSGRNKPSGHKRPDVAERCTGSKHHKAKMTEQDVLLARSEFANGVLVAHLAKRYGVRHITMSRAISGETWKHLN